MHRQPCVFCQRGPCVSAHVHGGGTGYKASARFTLPMCTDCHDGYDGRKKAGGRLTFLAERGLTMDDVLGLCDWIESRWQHYARSQTAEW